MKSNAIPLFNQKGDKLSDLPLNEKIFDGEVNIPLLHQAVRMYRANLRQGTHATKTRGEVSGGGKKPWRQKGTGRARAGSTRSPVWRHGGTVFGPHPRDYRYSLSKKIKKSALLSGLNAKINDGEVVLVNKLEVAKPKTKEFSAILEALKIDGKTLVVVDKMTDFLKLSSRNIPGISLKAYQDINAYDLLKHSKVLMEQTAFAALSKTFQGEN